jgi:predicted RNase H-like HicB family nuclease
MEYESIHVEVHHDREGYWAQVREFPGCFAAGRTLGELTEVLEESVALYLQPTEGFDDDGPSQTDLELANEDHQTAENDDETHEVAPVQLHIEEMVLRLGAERSFSFRDTATDQAVASPPRHRDPHYL